MKKSILVFLALCFATVAVFSLLQLLSITSTYREATQGYDELTQFVRAPESDSVEVNLPEPSVSEEDTPTPPHWAADRFPEVDFEKLGAINPDVAAWLILEDTQINYPVVQGGDNAFYLNHTFDGTRNKVGALFFDSNNTPGFADQNTIIYGHNMRDGSMFAALKNYQAQAFFDEHPYMLLLTPDGNYLVEIFAAYATAVTADSWRHTFDDEVDFANWIDEAKNRSDFTSDVEILPSDRVITLSTCSYVFDNARYVVVGRLVPIR